MKRPLSLAVIALALTLGSLGCDEESTEPNLLLGPAEFVASPDSLTFADEPGTAAFFLASPGGGRVTWSVASAPAWATITPREGTLDDGIVTVSVTGSADGVAPGIRTGRIELISTAGEAEVVLRFEVAVRRFLEVSTASITLGEEDTETSIELTNPGNAPSAWSVDGLPAWLEAVPSSGNVAPGETVSVTFRADRRGLPVGRLEAGFTLDTTAEGGARTLDATLDVGAIGLLSVNTPDRKSTRLNSSHYS